MEAELRAWMKETRGITLNEQLDRQKLIRLLQQPEGEFDRAFEQHLSTKERVSWPMLLALEQIDARRHRPTSKMERQEARELACRTMFGDFGRLPKSGL